MTNTLLKSIFHEFKGNLIAFAQAMDYDPTADVHKKVRNLEEEVKILKENQTKHSCS